MASTIKVQGLDQLLKNMQQLPRELVSKNGGLVRSALFRGAKLVRDDARNRAPKDTGAMAANIVATRDKNPQANGASERYAIGVRKVKKSKAKPDRADPYYWKFVEFGTEKMPATPFLRPAFEEQKHPVVDAFRDSLAKGIARTVKKMKK